MLYINQKRTACVYRALVCCDDNNDDDDDGDGDNDDNNHYYYDNEIMIMIVMMIAEIYTFMSSMEHYGIWNWCILRVVN